MKDGLVKRLRMMLIFGMRVVGVRRGWGRRLGEGFELGVWYVNCFEYFGRV